MLAIMLLYMLKISKLKQKMLIESIKKIQENKILIKIS